MTTKTTKTLLYAGLIMTMIIPLTLDQNVEAGDECPPLGMGGVNRCYAVKEYFLDTVPETVNVDITADDISVSEGIRQNSLWSHLSDGRFIEAGFQDLTSNNAKVVCGEDGGIDNWSSISLSDDDTFNAYSLDLGSGITWKTGIKHFDSSTEESCVYSKPSGTEMEEIEIGSESSKLGNSDYEHDWNDLEIDYTDVVSSDFSDTNIIEEGTDYDVEECGTGNELYRHIQTGKGDISSC